MREAWTTGRETLVTRLSQPAQIPQNTPEAEMPAYMESFLAHLRLLVGVPFDYLIPDARLLPDESIRFFYLDRSWADRLVDGGISVGKIGTREQAHHHAHHASVRQRLDVTALGVRDLQRSRRTFVEVHDTKDSPPDPVKTITGFLLRSAAVSGWPHMEVRAFDQVLTKPIDPAFADKHQLTTLRLERLSPSVLLALFQGVPKLVWCEEPHHGVQFGIHEQNGQFNVFRRAADGHAIGGPDTIIPVRSANRRVLGIAALRRASQLAAATTSGADRMPDQTGSASLAIELLNLPWRQRFQGQGGKPRFTGTGEFVAQINVAPRITQAELHELILGFIR
jgi:hypothetical protein